MKPLKLSIHEIEKTIHIKPFTFDREVDVMELAEKNNDIRDIKPAHVQGNCIVEGTDFIFSLNISGMMILPCARTLQDVPHHYDLQVIEIFTTSEYLTAEEQEEEVHLIDGFVIDLKPCILENILLHKPYRVFSKDQVDDMVYEGEGWELTLGDEKEEKEIPKEGEQLIDPRMAKLKNLLDENRNERS